MNLHYLYDPFLRKTVAPVTVFDDNLKKEAAEMLKIMKDHSGIGLSGNQVGLDKRIVVAAFEPDKDEDDLPRVPKTVLINPVIVKYSKDTCVMTEGCLSYPGLELPVRRSSKIVVEAQDVTGKKVTVRAGGLLARILLHEIDHLDGIIFSDRTDDYKKIHDYQFARIVFMGSDDFSQTIFEGLVKNKLNVMAVITETAKRAGRGDEIKEPIMAEVAKKHAIAVFQPETKEEIDSIVSQLEPDLIILASYGKILTEATLSEPIYGNLNVHPSLLPKYRGSTPIQSAILNGDKETGVTLMTMEPKVDAGKIVAQTALEINSDDTAETLRRKAAELGASLLIKNLPSYLSGQSKLISQDDTQATITKRFTKEIGEIDWNRSAEEISRSVRALDPWPGTFTFFSGKRLKLIDVEVVDEKIRPLTVQLEGKNQVSWKDFLNGYENELTKQSWYGKITK